MTVTSTSSRILHSLSGLSHPILRLILSAVRGHLDAYSDGGLRTALLLLRYRYISKIIDNLSITYNKSFNSVLWKWLVHVLAIVGYRGLKRGYLIPFFLFHIACYNPLLTYQFQEPWWLKSINICWKRSSTIYSHVAGKWRLILVTWRACCPL